MNVTIATATLPKTGALILPAVEGTSLLPTAEAVDKAMSGGLKRAMKAADFKGKAGQVLDVVAPEGVGVSRLYMVGLGAARSVKQAGLETAAGTMVARLNAARVKQASIAADPIADSDLSDADIAAHLAMGDDQGIGFFGFCVGFFDTVTVFATIREFQWISRDVR